MEPFNLYGCPFDISCSRDRQLLPSTFNTKWPIWSLRRLEEHHHPTVCRVEALAALMMLLGQPLDQLLSHMDRSVFWAKLQLLQYGSLLTRSPSCAQGALALTTLAG